METEEANQAVDDDVEMAEENAAFFNPKLLTGSEDISVPIPDAEVARREIINIPSQPARNFEAASPSGLNLNNDMPVDELMNSNHPREMLPLFQANVPRGGPRFCQRDHKPNFFGKSPYDLPKTSVSLRFWTQDQAIFYAQVLLNKDKLFKHSYLDIPSFYSALAFQNLTQIIDEFHAHRLFSLKDGYNPELIKQFYSTLYVSGNPRQPATWKFDYMIQGQVFHLTVDQIPEIVNLPQFEGLPHKLHTLPD